MNIQLDINLQTKVAEMLEHYPQLEEVLLELSPSFAKLKNPILRRTIAKVATLKQISEIAGINPGEMISTLRRGTNLGPANIDILQSTNLTRKPEWVNYHNIVETLDVSSILDAGKSPMKQIIDKAQSLNEGQILKLITPIVPIPIIEILQAKEYQCWFKDSKNSIITYIIQK